jgi:hypothetical protein
LVISLKKVLTIEIISRSHLENVDVWCQIEIETFVRIKTSVFLWFAGYERTCRKVTSFVLFQRSGKCKQSTWSWTAGEDICSVLAGTERKEED